MNIFTVIHSKYNNLTATEKKIADCVLEHAGEIVYMSITDMAELCDVGESSIFRFCKSLDFKGYQDFKIALAHSMTAGNEIPQLTEKIRPDDSIEQVAAKLLSANVGALQETHALMDPAAIDRTVDLLIRADRIVFFGVGASLVTSLDAHVKFMRITNKTICNVDPHLQMMTAALMTERDVAVIISYSGSTVDTIEVAKKVKERGATVISVTRFEKSPLTSHSDITLLCGANENPLQSGSISAKIAQLYLMDVLYTEYFKRTFEQSKENKDQTSAAVINKLL